MNTDLEHASRGGHEFQRTQVQFELKQFNRQTDGFGFVVSNGAVLDDDFGFHNAQAD